MTAHRDEQLDPRLDPRIDPRMEALLDEALSAESVPGGIPPGLAERIVQRTGETLAAAASDETGLTPTSARPGQPRRQPTAVGVLARIGPTQIRALAAAIVLAASIGVVIAAALIVRDARHMIDIRHDLHDLAQYEPPAEPIDQELVWLDTQLQLALNDANWAATQYLIDDGLIDLEWQVGTVETDPQF